jgi:hypothetical protein
VSGDKYQGVTVQGSNIAFGRGSQATVTTSHYSQGGGDNLTAVFAPLQHQIDQQAPTLSPKVNALKEQIALGSGADDRLVAGLVQDLVDGDSAVKSLLVTLFNNSEVSKTVGPRTEFVLERLGNSS